MRCNNWTDLKIIVSNKHSSLFCPDVRNKDKEHFVALTPCELKWNGAELLPLK